MTKKNIIRPCYPLAKHNASRQIGLFDVLNCSWDSSLYYNDPNCVYWCLRILVFMQKSVAFFFSQEERKGRSRVSLVNHENGWWNGTKEIFTCLMNDGKRKGRTQASVMTSNISWLIIFPVSSSIWFWNW